MRPRKREPLSRMLRSWLSVNRTGKLASDQWLNLLTAPLLTLIWLAVPLVIIFVFSPARVLLRLGLYSRLAIPVFLVAVVMMLLLRARHYARLPLYRAVLYADNQSLRPWTAVTGDVRLYDETGNIVKFDGFAASVPQLENDIPYLVYFLEEPSNRVLLSYAPLNHPDIDQWEPTDDFFNRQKRRSSAV